MEGLRILSELGWSAAPSRGSESSELKAEEPQALGRTFQAKRTHTDFRPRSGTIKGHRATPPLELSTPLPFLKGTLPVPPNHQHCQPDNNGHKRLKGARPSPRLTVPRTAAPSSRRPCECSLSHSTSVCAEPPTCQEPGWAPGSHASKAVSILTEQTGELMKTDGTQINVCAGAVKKMGCGGGRKGMTGSGRALGR